MRITRNALGDIPAVTELDRMHTVTSSQKPNMCTRSLAVLTDSSSTLGTVTTYVLVT